MREKRVLFMGYLKGTIQPKCQTDLPAGCVIKLLVFQTPTNRRPSSGGSNSAELIGKAEISNPPKFPIDFDIDFRDAAGTIIGDEYAVYLTVYVEKNGRILFSNENAAAPPSGEQLSNSANRMHLGNEYGDLVGRNGKCRRHLDVFLNSVTN